MNEVLKLGYLLTVIYCDDGPVDKAQRCQNGTHAHVLNIQVVKQTCPVFPTQEGDLTTPREHCTAGKLDALVDVMVDGKTIATLPASVLTPKQIELVKQLAIYPEEGLLQP